MDFPTLLLGDEGTA